MSLSFAKVNHFTNCGLAFPSSTSCYKVFNEIFVRGLSINQFESKYRTEAASVNQISLPNFTDSKQYNIRQDIWGPKEAVIIAKGHPDCGIGLIYGLRDPGEFTRTKMFLDSQLNATMIHSKPGNRVYEYAFYKHDYNDKRRIVISVVMETEQASKVAIMLDF